MNKGINLLGGERLRTSGANFYRIRLFRVIAVSILFGISGLSVVLFLLISLSPLPLLQQQEKQATEKIAQYHVDSAQLLLINDRLKTSKKIVATRSDYSSVLSSILAVLPSELDVTALVVKDKELSITVSGSSLLAMDNFFISMIDETQKKEYFSKTLITKFLYDQTTGLYLATVSVDLL